MNVVVAPEKRQHGYGRLLVHALVDLAAQYGMTVATLEVRPENTAARGLYRAYGFYEVGERKRYYPDGGDALIYTGAAADGLHAPGLVLLDRRNGTHRVLTTPELGEGAHVDPRLSSDAMRLVYASKHDGEAQLWQTDWPQLAQRSALLKRPEPVYGHAFEPKGKGLWVAGDLTLYRALQPIYEGV